jgi:rod shape-determining protein MreC
MPPFDPDHLESRSRRELWLSLFFVLLSGVLLVLPSHAQEQVAGLFRVSVLAPFIHLQESLERTRLRAAEISELQERLDAAVAALAARQTLLSENARLRELLDLQERAGPGFQAASVVRSGTRGSESMFLLDVGRDHGVQVNDPVVSFEGLVGVIRDVRARSSVAMDWTHPDFRVSAMTVDGRAFGLVEPRQGAFREEDRLVLNGVPYYTTLEPGTAVVTSGRGSVYPRGILVGTVDSLAETEAGWRRGYWLIPAVLPAAVNHVLVMTQEGIIEEEGALEALWVDPSAQPGAGGNGEDEE